MYLDCRSSGVLSPIHTVKSVSSSDTVGHEELWDQVHIPVSSFSHGIRGGAREVEALVELQAESKSNCESRGSD